MKGFSILVVICLLLISEACGAQDFKICENIKRTQITEPEKCWKQRSENLKHAIHSVQISIDCSGCEVLHGTTEQDVKNSQSTWNKFLSALLSAFTASSANKNVEVQTLRFSPFVDKYITIKPQTNATLRMTVETILDMSCMACLVSGVFLFFSAPSLSSSVKFYYTGGVGIGVLASVLIVVFILSRFIPKKPAAYTILLGGWSLTAFIMRKLYENWQLYLLQYQTYFLAYIAIAGFLSFALCYWKGPVEDPRSQRIIQWAIQSIGLTLLYCGTQSHAVSSTIVSCVLLGSLLKNKPNFQILSSLKSFGTRFKWRHKLEQHKLLTEEEYRVQGELETKKALEELRKYCDSPQWSPHRWKTMARMKSPAKFASFLDGEDHVSDSEMTLHDAELSDMESEEDLSLITDDEEGNGDVRHRGDNHIVTVYKRMEVQPEISEDED
uniref:nuclear envelope integral membrane protein 1-like n=1 Tax=Styela clava TaxID=7725 RepID=UPI00193A23FF|nr:nuclear envelope integral membrane protein 1-like [Styela clava]XP_039266534.1 nuclear envelope integral membrane protein 1-like [Styela clava]